MKSYPSITTHIQTGIPVTLYDKLDGSNIRAEWNKKRGFYKFGSRTQLIDENSFILGESISLINEKYSEDLSKKFTDKKFESAVCFFEFSGENSFAGHHEFEPHDVVLFDIDVYKKGLLTPEQFQELTQDIETAACLCSGIITSEMVPTLVQQVREGIFPGITFEGVVGKCVVKNQVKMFKIKTNAWLDKLKTYCGDNIQLYEKLK